MYQSKAIISTEGREHLEKRFLKFLKDNEKIYCKSLKRTIFFSKMPDAILQRKSSATLRLKRFFVAIDIIRHEKRYKKHGVNEYEIVGLDKNGKHVTVHVREEVNSGKDKKVYFVSCY